MQTYLKYLLTVIVLLVVGLGGFTLYKKQATPNTPSNAITETIPSIEISDYLAAQPHYGPLVITQTITVTFNKDSATGEISQDKIVPIEPGQDVILYDKDGHAMPLGGVVKSTENNKVIITLPQGTKTDHLLGELDIITLETKASARLPLSALQTDETGESFIWLAQHDISENSFTFTRHTIKKGLSDATYFEESGFTLRANDLIVLNPDDKIRSDKKYMIIITNLNAPLMNPISQAWVDYELYRLQKQQDEMHALAAECDSGGGSLDQNITDLRKKGGACGGGNAVDYAKDPMEIFNALINRGTGGTDGSSSCSGSCGAH